MEGEKEGERGDGGKEGGGRRQEITKNHKEGGYIPRCRDKCIPENLWLCGCCCVHNGSSGGAPNFYTYWA